MPSQKRGPRGAGDDRKKPEAAGLEKGNTAGPLTAYRAKRSADRTYEPFGVSPDDASSPATAAARRPAPESAPRGIFVIQKHAARRLHYDLRLEWGGTLHSWAVPNGIPLATSEKRIAIEVEDHPIEYADFEGIIPNGNYGAGAAIVWDRGHWVPREDPQEGLVSGKLHFDLRGHKLHGTWILVRTKGEPKSWLLMRKLERGEAAEHDAPGEESILSGLRVEELSHGGDRAAEIRADLERSNARRAPTDPARVGLMLAEVAAKPFSRPGWIFEIKYDGYRALGSRGTAGRSSIRSRGGEEMAAVFPEIARALEALPYEGFVVDGELVVLDDKGHPDFHALQRRGTMRRRIDVEAGAREHPVTFFVFDLLAIEGFDLRDRPLLERKALLRRVLPPLGPLRYCDHIEERGEEMFEIARKMDLEGVIAKRADAPYTAGRSGVWQKFVADRTGDFVVVGYTEMGGTRGGDSLGALMLAVRDEGGGWKYAGRVGTGLTDLDRSGLRRQLEPHVRQEPVCELPAGERTALKKTAYWVEPRFVVAVRYRSMTEGGMLRAPVFVRMREDKGPEECDEPVHPADPPVARNVKKVVFRHLDKVFWPDDGLTKGDLIDYYRAVAGRMLPYLEDRPVVLTRYPDGIAGKSFFQKDAPAHAPDWIRTAKIYSSHTEKEIAYFVCDDVDDLLYLANLGSIPIHVWSSRISTISNPDWCILDLDPKGAPFSHVVRLALSIRELCEEIRIPSFVKTSGSTGLHILIPLPPGCTYEQSRIFAQLLCGIIEGRHPDISTTARSIPARKGRVYLDALQNRHGQLLVAPYSVRPLPTAPVSAPLQWTEVDDRLEPRAFTIRNMRERLARQEEDPMEGLLRTRPDLRAALDRLGAKVAKAQNAQKVTKAQRPRVTARR